MAPITGAHLIHDTQGDVAQLHGIGVQRFNGFWYAYGENKVAGNLFQGVSCYKTADFRTWQNKGIVLTVGEPGSAIGPERIVERPKMLLCPFTGRYVMFVHVDGADDYGYAHVGVAVSDSPTGPFGFMTTQQWRGFSSRDIGVFQDEDGSGYLLSEDREHGTHIYRLSDDFLSIVDDVACERGPDGVHGYESPTIVKKDGVYYWFGSQLTGWSTNDNMVSTASNLRGPWSQWRPFAPVGSHTFDSQCDVVVPLDEDQWHSRHFLYIGDRWRKNDLGNSPLVTLPIEISDGNASLSWVEEAACN